MLHRSFKPAKCKTSLKLAVARLKLLKNKREVQVRQMKKDLAHLLETGQEKTAMIRVEHVVREEKTMAAYDFIDIYCELIVARLPIIESQKTCPIDLKEAVASLVFVSPRCADIPELLDVRKQFTAKYGKEFITSSLELRPNCGVNRTVVENLSARTPDGQTKLKILADIAKEHNVEWDPKAFGEKELKPPEDLLNGPNVNEFTSGGPAEPHPNHLPSYGGRPESTYASDATGSSWISHTTDPTNIKNPNMATHTSAEQRTSGNAGEGGYSAHQESQNTDQYRPNRQNWNMEFKDATSAAQAAAESAERASFAARAAAELSSQYSGIYPTKSHDQMMHDQQRHSNERESTEGVSDSSLEKDNSMRRRNNHPASPVGSGNFSQDPSMQDQRVQRNEKQSKQGVSDSMLESEDTRGRRDNHYSTSSVGSGKYFREPSMQDQKLHRDERQNTQGTFDNTVESEDITRRKNRRSTSVLSHRSDEDDFERRDAYNTKHSSEEIKIQSSHIDVGFEDHHEPINRPGYTDPMKEGITRRSSRSSSSFSDDNGDIMPSRTNNNPPIVFDEYVWDDETIGHKEVFYDSPPRTKSPPQFAESQSIWSPSRNSKSNSPSEFSERKNESSSPIWSPVQNSGGSLEKTSSGKSHFPEESNTASELFERENKASSPSQSIDFPPVTFDESDGAESEIEEEVNNSKLSGRISPESTQSPLSSFPVKEAQVPNRKPSSYSSSDDSNSEDAYPKSNQGRRGDFRNESRQKETPFVPVIEEKQSSMRSPRYSLSRNGKTSDDFGAPGSQDKVKDLGDSGSESDKELNLGGLRGGFRNKGYTRPPYRSGVSPPKQTENPSEQLKVSSELHQPTVRKDTSSRNSRTTLAPENDDDDTGGFKRRSSGSRVKPSTTRLPPRTREPSILSDSDDSEGSKYQTSGSRVHKDTSSKNPRRTFGTDNDDTEGLTGQSSGSRIKPGTTRLSRRTREPSTLSDASGPSTAVSVSKMDNSKETQNVHVDPQPEKMISGSRRSFRTNVSAEQKPDTPVQSRHEEKPKLTVGNVTVEHQPSKPTRSLREENSLPSSYSATKRTERLPREEKLESSQSLPEQSSKTLEKKEPVSRENSLNKNPGHVHPKLPEYDSFTAHFKSLRSNR